MRRTKKELAELRDKIYNYYLQQFSERDIASMCNVSQSHVSRQLQAMREENIAWFQNNKNPKTRHESYFKELFDIMRLNMREAYTLLVRAKEEKASVAVTNGVIATCINAAEKMRLQLRIILPSMDEVYFTEQMQQAERDIFDLRQLAKIIKPGVMPLAGSSKNRAESKE